MNQARPFVREAGAGPAVVCLHSNASSSSQWRALMERLAPTHHVLAPDSWGSGKSPEWPSDRVISLADEVALIEPVLARAQAPFVLVGHSYGAAVALLATLARPERVRALVLYEPTMFSVIDADAPAPNEADGIRAAVAAAARELDRGDRYAAAEAFIDYWMGAGALAVLPDSRREPIVASVVNVRRWEYALFTEPSPLAAFGALRLPVLLMTGKRSTAAAAGVARRLAAALPQVRRIDFEGLGHMGPISHPQLVNEAIAAFLADPGEPA
ncbi:MAG: alpha/beta hydrolase [Caldimonas sp.]